MPAPEIEQSVRLQTAYHEAGHAVVGFFLGEKYERVSIVPREVPEGPALGYCERLHSEARLAELVEELNEIEKEERNFGKQPEEPLRRQPRALIRDQFEREIQVQLAGEIAEAYFIGGPDRWGLHHRDEVNDLARSMNGGNPQRAKYGLQMRVLDLASWIGGRIGRRVVLEVVLSGKNTPAMITTPTSN